MNHEVFPLGIIGTGNIAGAYHAPLEQFPDKVRLVGVADSRPDAAAAFAARHEGAVVFADVPALLADPQIEGVIICTTHASHHPLAKSALEAGKHVLVEKPLACTVAEGRELVELAAARGLTLMVAQCQRYDPSYRGIKAVVDSEDFGKVLAVRFDAMQGLFKNDVFPRGHWLTDGAIAGGGIVISVLVHRIDLVRYLVGDVIRVSATYRTADPEFKNGAEDFAAALLEFENGAIGQMFGTYSGYRMPYSEGLMIFGESGAVHAQPDAGNYQSPGFYATRTTPRPRREEDLWMSQFRDFLPVPPTREGLPTEHQFVNETLHFAECVRSGREPLSSGRDNLGTLKVIEGCAQSARTGSWVNLASL